MTIFGKKTTIAPTTPYATATDFCRIFADDMDRLYRLSLMLTADPELSEKCFVRGLEDARNGNPVFKEWAQSWARRTVIVNAIRAIGPRADGDSSQAANRTPRVSSGLPAELDAVMKLDTFERFVFVMSVLESYPERDCRLLLGCSSQDVVQARTRALKHLADIAQTRNKISNSQAVSYSENVNSAFSTGVMPRLAVSA
jgi:DNA-directed RNA polymerase specialized sigma24 family protein